MIDRITPSRLAPAAAVDVQRSRTVVPTTVEAVRTVAEAAASLVSEPRRIAAEGPPIDSARVDRLRAAIVDGSYAVDPEHIAAAMIASEQRA